MVDVTAPRRLPDHPAGGGTSMALTRELGSTGIEVTRLCVGAAAWSPLDHPHGGSDPAESAALADALLRSEVVRYLDTSNNYGAGESERRIGSALRKAGHVMLDCPVSGTGSQAQVKDLVIYASGDSRTIRQLRPLFAGFSRAMHDLGAFGNGSRMKYVANLLVAINNVASAEAMVLGLKAGLDPQTVFEMVKSGAGNSRVFELRAPMMVKDRYDDATMKVSVWQKDMAVIGEFAKTLGVPTPMFDASVPIYRQAMKSGHAEHDTAAVCAVLETMAGVKRGRKGRAKKRGR